MSYAFPAAAVGPQLYLPSGWDAAWQTGKINAGTKQARIWVLGDSTTQGTSQLSDVLVDTWLRKVLNRLPHNPWSVVRGNNLGGDFFNLAYSQVFWTAAGAGTIPGAVIPFTSMQATGRFSFSHPWGSGYWWDSSASGLDLVTFNTPYACTDLDIITLDYAASSWQYKIDGGSAQTVTIASGNTATTAPRRTSISGLANTTHTILITNPSANNGAVMLLGCACYKNRNAGIAAAWADGTGQPLSADMIPNFPATKGFLLPQGYTTTAQNDAAFGFPAQADLAIFAMGINDCQGNGFSPHGFYHAYRKACQAARRGTPNATLLFLPMSNPDSQSSDMTSSWFTNSNLWPAYIEAMMAVAREFYAGVANVHARWNETAVASGYQLSAGNAHPSVLGHSDIASFLLGIL